MKFSMIFISVFFICHFFTNKYYKNSNNVECAAVTKRLWINGFIPYKFFTNHFSKKEQEAVISAMNYLSRYTNINFIEETNERNYFVTIRKYNITNGEPYNCSAEVGSKQHLFFIYPHYRQFLKLSSSCILKNGFVYMKALVHELMHVLGFYHEQQRPDRDLYISVLHNNIVNSTDIIHSNYDMNSDIVALEKYDFLSVLHYNPFSFSVNGFPTLIPNKCKTQLGKIKSYNLSCQLLKKMIKKSNQHYISPLSNGDICALQHLYGKPLTKNKIRPCLQCKTTGWRLKRTKNNQNIYYRFIHKYNNECIKIEIESISGKTNISILDI
jgi:hypothetical protein